MDGHGEGATLVFVLRLGSWFRFHLIYDQTDGLAVVLYGGREKLAQVFLKRIMMTFFMNPRLEAEINGHAGSTPLFVLRVGSWFRFHLIYDQTNGLAVNLYGGRDQLVQVFPERIMTTFFMNPRLEAEMDGHSEVATPLSVLRVGSWFRFHLIYDHTYTLAGILYGGRQMRAEIFLQRIMRMFFMNWVHRPE